MKSRLVFFLSLIVLVSCAYVPSKVAYKNIFKKEIYVEIHINDKYFERYVKLKDDMMFELRKKFGITIVDKADNVPTLKLNFSDIRYIPIEWDSKSNPIRYKAKILLTSHYNDLNKTNTIISKGESIYLVSQSHTLSIKVEQIKKASMYAFTTFIKKNLLK